MKRRKLPLSPFGVVFGAAAAAACRRQMGSGGSSSSIDTHSALACHSKKKKESCSLLLPKRKRERIQPHPIRQDFPLLSRKKEADMFDNQPDFLPHVLVRLDVKHPSVPETTTKRENARKKWVFLCCASSPLPPLPSTYSTISTMKRKI